MIGELFGSYLGALADFWGATLRLGLPHLVLLILILMWLRRGRCGKWRRGRSCCWAWRCGAGRWDGDCDEPAARGWDSCCRSSDEPDEPEAEDGDEDGDS